MGPSQAQKPFRVPHFLFAGKRFQPPRPFLSSKGRFQQLLIRGVRECRSKGGTVKNNSAGKGHTVRFLLKGPNLMHVSELFYRNWGPPGGGW